MTLIMTNEARLRTTNQLSEIFHGSALREEVEYRANASRMEMDRILRRACPTEHGLTIEQVEIISAKAEEYLDRVNLSEDDRIDAEYTYCPGGDDFAHLGAGDDVDFLATHEISIVRKSDGWHLRSVTEVYLGRNARPTLSVRLQEQALINSGDIERFQDLKHVRMQLEPTSAPAVSI